MPRLRNRPAFALPMTILVIAVLTAAIAATYVSTTSELTTNAAQRGTERAYNLAETGLEEFMVRRSETGFCNHCASDPTTADSEWTHIVLPGGYADVVSVRVRPMVGNNAALFFIRSRGRDTSAKLSGSASSSVAEHTVGTYARWNTATMNVKGAWLSLSGLNKSGTGVISGVDACGASPSLAGVMVPKGDLTVSGGSFNPQGNPPVDTTQTYDSLKTKTGIDWASIIGGSITPDITIPGQSFPLGSVFDNNPDYWPVIRIHTNNFPLPNHGRGMIIADSNFTISGSNMWDGVVLIGGKLTSNGNNTTSGATVSGLNDLIGGVADTSTVGDADANGQKTYLYNSCNVSKATAALRRYVAMPNAWSDNVAGW
jgi:hypothetical protein